MFGSESACAFAKAPTSISRSLIAKRGASKRFMLAIEVSLNPRRMAASTSSVEAAEINLVTSLCTEESATMEYLEKDSRFFISSITPDTGASLKVEALRRMVLCPLAASI